MALTKLSLMPQANVTTPCSQLITHNGIMVHKPPRRNLSTPLSLTKTYPLKQKNKNRTQQRTW